MWSRLEPRRIVTMSSQQQQSGVCVVNNVIIKQVRPRPTRCAVNFLWNANRGLLTLFCLYTLLLGESRCSDSASDVTRQIESDIACSSVKYAYTAKGIFKDEDDVPQEAIEGKDLLICERGMTCCTREMESRLSNRSKDEFNRLLKNTVGELKNVYAVKATKFDEFFRGLLDRSKKDFHKMFLKTYGMLYETNSYLFEDMFKDLENYYEHGNVDLSDALDNFFNRLYKKMFQVLNAQYGFSEKYMTCIGEKMEELKPFGDIPKKLTMEVKRSFVATRTFHQALNMGRDVLKVMADVGPTPICSTLLMKMTYCPHCRGLPDLKPCSNYCLGVMRECLANDGELDAEWNNFTTHLDNLGGRLETSFNIESVVDPIDIKISEAIMNFQENGHAVSQKLFDICGRPRVGKRSAPVVPETPAAGGPISTSTSNSELHFEKFKFSSTLHTGSNKDGLGSADEETMISLVQSIRKRVKRSSNFWNHLPVKMCRHPDVAGATHTKLNGDEKDCWNGQAKPHTELIDSTSTETSIDTKIEYSQHTAIINQQVLTLKLFTNKLRHAYNGLDVVWLDDDSDDWVSSGSGSGSGYGETQEGTGGVSTDGYNDIYFSSSTTTVDPRNNAAAAPSGGNSNSNRNKNKISDPKHHKPSAASSFVPNVLCLFVICAILRPFNLS